MEIKKYQKPRNNKNKFHQKQNRKASKNMFSKNKNNFKGFGGE